MMTPSRFFPRGDPRDMTLIIYFNGYRRLVGCTVNKCMENINNMCNLEINFSLFYPTVMDGAARSSRGIHHI